MLDLNSENRLWPLSQQHSAYAHHHCPARSSGGGRPPLSEPRILDGGYAPPQRGESSPELQRVQGAGALERDGSQLCPDRQHVFRLTEIYESKAGVADHFEQTNESWVDFPAMGKWMEKCKVTFVPAASIINSLW